MNDLKNKFTFDLQRFATVISNGKAQDLQNALDTSTDTQIEVSSSINISTNQTIDFKGKTVVYTGSGNGIFNVTDGTLTLKSTGSPGGIIPDSKSNAANSLVYLTGNGAVTFDSGFSINYTKSQVKNDFSIVWHGSGAFQSTVTVKEGASIITHDCNITYDQAKTGLNFTMEGGTITCDNTDNPSWGAIYNNSNSKFTMSGGTINFYGGCQAVSSIGTSNVDMKGGTINAYNANAYAFYLHSSGTSSFTNATINSQYGWGLCVTGNAGNCTIGSGTSISTAGISVGHYDGGSGTITVNNGASIKSSGSYGIYCWGANNAVTVNGGTVEGVAGIYSPGSVTVSNGTIIGTSSTSASIFSSGSNANANVSGGTIGGANYGVYLNNGAHGTISGGTFNSSIGVGVEAKSSLNEVTGGTFNSYLYDLYLAKGASTKVNGFTYTSFGEVQLKFDNSDLKSATAVTSFNGTVDITGNAEATVTVDGTSYTLGAADAVVRVSSSGVETVTNGKVTISGIENGRTINDVKYSGSGKVAITASSTTSGDQTVVSVSKRDLSGEVTIQGADTGTAFTAAKDSVLRFQTVDAEGNVTATKKITVGSDNTAVSVVEGGITIGNATITGADSYDITVDENGNIKGLPASGATVSISGNTETKIYTVGENIGAATYVINGSIFEVSEVGSSEDGIGFTVGTNTKVTGVNILNGYITGTGNFADEVTFSNASGTIGKVQVTGDDVITVKATAEAVKEISGLSGNATVKSAGGATTIIVGETDSEGNVTTVGNGEFTIGGYTFAISGNKSTKTDDGGVDGLVTFTLDSTGKVTKINGLAEGAVVRVSGSFSDSYTIEVNDQPFATTGADDLHTIDADKGKLSIISTADNGNAQVLDKSPYIVDVSGTSPVVYLGTLDGSGIKVGDPLTEDEYSEAFTYSSGTLTLAEGFKPSSGNPITIVTGSTAVTVKSSDGETTYLNGASGFTATNAIQVIDDKALKLVKGATASGSVSDITAAPTAGTVTLASGQTLNANGYWINAQADGAVTFSGTNNAPAVSLGAQATVTNADTSTTFTLATANTAYTINGVAITGAANSTAKAGTNNAWTLSNGVTKVENVSAAGATITAATSGTTFSSLAVSTASNANANGTYEIGGKSITVKETDAEPNGVTFTITSGNLTKVENINSGTLSTDFANAVTVGSSAVRVSGTTTTAALTISDGAVSEISGIAASSNVVSTGGATKITTAAAAGTYTIGNVAFTTTDTDGITFTLDSSGKVTAINGLNEGATLKMSGTGLANTYTVNGITYGTADTNNVKVASIADSTIVGTSLGKSTLQIGSDSRDFIVTVTASGHMDVKILNETNEVATLTDVTGTVEGLGRIQANALYLAGSIDTAPLGSVTVINSGYEGNFLTYDKDGKQMAYINNSGSVGLKFTGDSVASLVSKDTPTSNITSITSSVTGTIALSKSGMTLNPTNDAAALSLKSNNDYLTILNFDSGNITLGRDMTVSGTTAASQNYKIDTLANGATFATTGKYTINSITFDINANKSVTMGNGYTVGNKEVIVKDKDDNFVEGYIVTYSDATTLAVSNLPNAYTKIGLPAAGRYFTDTAFKTVAEAINATYNFNGSEYAVSDTGGGVTFNLSSGVGFVQLKKISDLVGTITGDFRNGIAVNTSTNSIKVTGDASVIVSATSAGAVTISDVDDGATVDYKGSATVKTSGNGTFKIGDTTFTISGDTNGATFTLNESGSVTGISDLTAGAIITASGSNSVNQIGTGTVSLTDGKSYIVGASGNSATSVSDTSFLIEITGASTANVYSVNTSTNATSATVGSTTVLTLSGNTATLAATIVPSASTPITIVNKNSNSINLKATSASTVDYTIPANSTGAYGLKLDGNSMNIVTTATSIAAATTVNTGTFTIPSGMPFNVTSGYTIESATSVTLGTNALTLPAGATASGVPSDTVVTFDGTSATVNGYELTLGASSMTGTVTSTGGITITTASATNSVTYDGIKYNGTAATDTVTIGGASPILKGAITVTNASAGNSFVLTGKSSYTIGGITVDASAAADTVTATATVTSDGISIGSGTISTDDTAFTAKLSSTGAIDTITLSAAGKTVTSAGGATSITSKDGATTIGDKTFTVTGTPTFALDGTTVTGISGVNEVTGDFSSGIKVIKGATLGDASVTVTGDTDVTVAVEASGATAISNVNSGANIFSAGGATKVTAVTSSTTSSSTSGDSSDSVDTSADSTSASTFTIGGVAFTITGDADNVVEFTLDTSGNVTAITGLDADATLEMSGTISSITVNNVTYGSTSSSSTIKLNDITKAVIVGTSDGKSSTVDLSSMSIKRWLVDVTAAAKGTFYALDDSGNVNATITGSEVSGVGSIASNNLTLDSALNVPVVVKGSGAGITGYATGFTLSDHGLQLDADKNLSLVSITNNDSSATITPLKSNAILPTSLAVTLASDTKLTITTDTDYSYISSDTTVAINGLTLTSGVRVKNAPANTTFTMSTAGTYTVNGRELVTDSTSKTAKVESDGVTLTISGAAGTFTDTTNHSIAYTIDASGSVKVTGDNESTLSGTVTVDGGKDNEQFTLTSGAKITFKNGNFSKVIDTAADVTITLTDRGFKLADDNAVNIEGDEDGYTVTIDSNGAVEKIKGLSKDSSLWSFGAANAESTVKAVTDSGSMTAAAFTFANGTFTVTDNDTESNGVTFQATNDNYVIRMTGLDDGQSVTVGSADKDSDTTYSTLTINNAAFTNVLAGTVIKGVKDSAKTAMEDGSTNWAVIDADGYLIDVDSDSAVHASIMQNEKVVADAASGDVVQDATFKLVDKLLSSNTAITTIVEDTETYSLTNSTTTLFSGLTAMQDAVSTDTAYGIKASVDSADKVSLTLVDKDKPFAALDEIPVFGGAGLTIYSDAALSIATSGSSVYQIESLAQTAINFSSTAVTASNGSTTYTHNATLNGAANVTETFAVATFQLGTDTNVYGINDTFFQVTETATIDVTTDSTTLFEGTVVLNFESSTIQSVVATNSGTATVSSGTVFAKAENGVLKEISNIDVGEAFTLEYSDTTQAYKMTRYGLAVDDDNDQAFSGIYETVSATENAAATFAIDNTYSATALLDATSGKLTLTTADSVTSIFVDDTKSLETFYTKMEVDGNTYTFSTLDSDATEIDATAITSSSTYVVNFDAAVKVGAESMSENSVAFTVNEKVFNALGALEIAAYKSSDSTTSLTDGLVLVETSSTLAATFLAEDSNTGKTLTIGDKGDGVKASVKAGVLSSITDLEADEVVTLKDASGTTLTYTGFGGTMTLNDGTTTTIYGDITSATNILDVAELPSYIYASMTSKADTIVLKTGADILTDKDVGSVIYGTNTTFAGSYFANLTSESATAYTLKKNTDSNSETVTSPIVDASGIASSEAGLTLTLDFAAQVTADDSASTSTNITYTINNTGFLAASKVTVDYDGTNTTLYDGTVGLNTTDFKDVTATASGTVVALEGSIFATAETGSITSVSDINVGEKFSAYGETYSQVADGLLKGTADGYTGINLDFASGTYDFKGTFTNLAEAASGAITFTSSTQIESVFVNSLTDPQTFYAKVSSATGTVYTFDGLSSVTSATSIDATSFEDGVKLKVNFNLDTVKVGTADSATTTAFTINDKVYDAYDVLTVAAKVDDTATSSTLTEGTVNVNSNTFIFTTDGKEFTGVANDADGVVVKVANGSATSITDLEDGVTVVYGGNTYAMGSGGQLETNVDGVKKSYSGASTDTNVLNPEGLSASAYVQITDKQTLELDKGIEALSGDDVVDVVTYGTPADAGSNYFAELTAETSNYKFEQNTNENSSEVLTQPVIVDGQKVTGGFNLSLDFDAQVKTSGTNVFTINNEAFSAVDDLTINVAGTATTLLDGTVALDTSDYKAITTTGGNTITETAGNGITVDVASGTSETLTVGALDNGDAFNVNEEDYYKKVSAGIVKGSADGTYDKLAVISESSITLNDASINYYGMLQGGDTLTLTTNVETGTSVFVDNTNDPTKFYAMLDKTANTYAFTQDSLVGEAFTAIDATAYTSTVKLDVSVNDIAVSVGAADADSVKYNVNDVDYNALSVLDIRTEYKSVTDSAEVEDGIAISADGDDIKTSKIYAGDVQVTADVAVTSTKLDTASVTGDEDGVKVKVVDGKITSITGLDVGGTLTFDESGTTKTFTMTDGIVTTNDGTLYSANSDTNLVDLDSSTARAYVQLTNDGTTLDLNKGASELSVAPAILYGIEESYATKQTFFATMDGDKAAGSYNITKDGTETVATPKVDASQVDGFKSVTLDFAAQVLTPSDTGVYTVNNTAFNAVTGLTIDFDATNTTLYDGTVGLDSTYKDVKATNSDTVAVSSGSIEVAVNEGKVVSFGDLDYGESFALSVDTATTTYTLVDAIQNVVRNDGTKNSLWTGDEVLSGTVTVDTLNKTTWNNMVAGEANSLTLQATETNITFVDDVTAPTALYANQTYAANSYTLASQTSLGDAVTLNAAAMADGDALTFDFAASVTLQDSGTYTINTAKIAAADSVTLDATTATATFNSGKVFALEDIAVNVTGGVKVEVASDSNGVIVEGTGAKLSSIKDLNDNAVVTITEGSTTSTYQMFNTGVLKVTDADGVKYYTGENSETNILDLENSAQAAYVSITSGVLNLESGTSQFNDKIAAVLYGTREDFDGTNYFATMTQSGTGVYSFVNDGTDALDVTPTINGADGNGFTGLTTDFVARVTTPDKTATYSIDGTNYAAESQLEVDATSSTDKSTLFNGTVSLVGGGNYAEVDPSNDSNVTATNGDLDITVVDGKITNVGDVENGETFTIGDDTYTKTTGGLFKKDADGNEAILTGSADSDTVSFDPTSADWNEIYGLNDDGEFIVYLDSDTTQTFYNKDRTAVVAEYDGEKKILTAGDAASEVKGVKIVGDEDDFTVSLTDTGFTNANISLDAVKEVGNAIAGQNFIVPNVSTTEDSSVDEGIVKINDKSVKNTATGGKDALVTNMSTGFRFGENGEGGLVSLTDGSDTALTGYTVALDSDAGLSNASLELPGSTKGALTTSDEFESGKVTFAIPSKDRVEEFDIANDVDDNGVTFRLNDGSVYEIIDLAPNSATVTVKITNSAGDENADDSQADVLAPSSGKITFNADGESGHRWQANTETSEPTEVSGDSDNYIVYINSAGDIKLLVKDSETELFKETTLRQDYLRVLGSDYAPLTDGARLKNISATGSDIKLAATYGEFGVTFVNDSAIEVKVTDSSGNNLLSKVVTDSTENTVENSFRLNSLGATVVDVTAATDGDGNTTATSKASAVTPTTELGIVKNVEVSLANNKTLVLNGDDYKIIANTDTVVTLSETGSDVAVSKAATITAPASVVFKLATDAYTVNEIALNTTEATVTTASNGLNLNGTFEYTDVTVTTATDSDAQIVDGALILANGSTATTSVDSKAIEIASDATVTVNTVQLTTLANNATVTTQDGKLLLAAQVECTDITLSEGTMTVTTDTKQLLLNNDAVVLGKAETGFEKDLALATDAVVTINGIEGLSTSSTDTAITAVYNDSIKFTAGSETVTYGNLTFSGGKVAIDADGVTLSNGAIVTDISSEYTFTVEKDAAVTIDGKTFVATDGDVVVTNAYGGFEVGDETLTITNDDNFTVKASTGDIIEVSGVSSDASLTTISDVGGNASVNVVTDSEGAFKFGEKTFTITSDTSVVFGVEDNKVRTISDLDGVVVGNFSTAVTVDGGRVYIAGDDTVSVTATTSRDPGVTDINGVGASDLVKVIGAGGATLVSTNMDGTFQFSTVSGGGAGQVYTTHNDSDVSFLTTIIAGNELQAPSVIGVNGLDNGSIELKQDAVNGFAVNGTPISLSGADSLAPVTLTAADSVITAVDGLKGSVNGLTGAPIVSVVDSDVTINSAALIIDEGSAGTSVTAILEDGVMSSVTGLNKDATVYTAANVSIGTEEEGAFTFDKNNATYTISGDDNVTFVTDAQSRVADIVDFDGKLQMTATSTRVNGATVALNLAGSDAAVSDVTIASAGDGVDSVLGLGDGDSVTVPVGAFVAMPANSDTSTPVTLTINGKKYGLKGDADGVAIKAGSGVDTITGLDPKASLVAENTAARYIVNGTPIEAGVGAVIIGDEEGTAHLYDPTDVNITEEDSPETVVDKITGTNSDTDNSRYVESLSSNQAAELIDTTDTSKVNGNIQMALTNSDTSQAQVADFSSTTGIKKVTLESGEQDVSFNNAGGNIAIVSGSSDNSASKNINLGNGGDIAVIGTTEAPVNVRAGRGKDTIVAQGGGKVTVNLNAGGAARIMANGVGTSPANVDLDGYDHNTGAGVQVTNSDIKKAVKSNTIQLKDGSVTVNNGTINLGASRDSRVNDASVVNLYDLKGRVTKVAFTDDRGGSIDLSSERSNLILKGNYTEGGASQKNLSAQGTVSTLKGGSGDDYALAGAGDNIDLGEGNNEIILDSDTRTNDSTGAIISQTATRGTTTVENFHNDDFSGQSDGVSISPNAKVRLVNGVLTFVLGAASLILNGIKSFGSGSADLAEINDADDNATAVDGKVEYAPILLNGVKTAVASDGNWIGADTLWSDEENMPVVLVGGEDKGSGVDLRSFEGEVALTLPGAGESNDEVSGNIGSAGVYLRDIDKVRLGTGNSTVVGNSNANNTIVAGLGNSNIWGGGESNDVLIGRQDGSKTGSTSFLYLNGDGRDTISNFEYLTADNGSTADKIDVDNQAFTGIVISGSDVVATRQADTDRLTIKNAVGKDAQVAFNNNGVDTILTAQVATTSLNFDNRANFYYAAGKNASVVADSSLSSVAAYLDDYDVNGQRFLTNRNDTFVGDIKYLSAASVEGNASLVGNSNNNTLIGGKESSSMWGGWNGGDDSLVGGAGLNTFFYGKNNGNDVISNVKGDDLVYFYDLTVDDVKGEVDLTTSSITITFKDSVGGGSLVINSNNSGIGLRAADGTVWTVDQRTRDWSKK